MSKMNVKVRTPRSGIKGTVIREVQEVKISLKEGEEIVDYRITLVHGKLQILKYDPDGSELTINPGVANVIYVK